MNKKLLIAITVLCSIALISVITVIAQTPDTKYKISFQNDSSHTVTYYLYQIDHGLTHPKPIAFVVGTLHGGKSWEVKREYGHYYLEWKHKDRVVEKTDPFYIDKDMKFVYG